MTDDELIHQEIELLLNDIIKEYEASGKKVSGEFPHKLTAIYEPNKATIKGYVYLAGRKAGKRPPSQAIEQWIKQKGIFNVKTKSEIKGLAYIIARKIGEKGTNKEYEMKIYEKVITPQRINTIINNVAKLNVNRFIEQINVKLEILIKNV